MDEHNNIQEYGITGTQIGNEEYIRIHWTTQQLPGYEETYYITGDNMEFDDYEEALEHEIRWLKQKYVPKKDEEIV